MAGLDKIESARSVKGGNWLKDGIYPSLMIKHAELDRKFKGEMLILELLVDEEPQANEPGVEPNAKGSSVSKVFNLDTLMGPINARGFVLSLFGLDEATLKPGQVKELVEFMTGKDDPCRGMRIRCETYRKAKKEKPDQIMTLENWKTYKQDAAMVKAARAELDGGAK